MLIVGLCLASFGGLAMLFGVFAAGKGAMAEGFDFVVLFGLTYLRLPGLALAAAGAVLVAVQRRSAARKAADPCGPYERSPSTGCGFWGSYDWAVPSPDGCHLGIAAQVADSNASG